MADKNEIIKLCKKPKPYSSKGVECDEYLHGKCEKNLLFDDKFCDDLKKSIKRHLS